MTWPENLCISKKTLYEHFADKEDLVAQVMLMEHARWFEVLNEAGRKEL
ncbi:MAG: TetR/AcrR family transcriptional regulator [Marinilabiliales bacterium]|nr:TetR/AcrR family transcriptional regulator [Marinilabiliales bacterium]